MEIPTCGNCHRPVLVTPMSAKVRCHCEAMITIGKWQTAPKVPCRRCWKTKQGGTLAPPVQRPNPMNSSAGHRPKRAVLCGVSYQIRKHKLKGPINDVNIMKSLLIERFNFPESSICVLTGENDPSSSPTRENILKALTWLVADCEPGDSLVFYFSGHGLRQPDFNGDELDGYDETICPSDFMTAGMILDNDINTTIVKPLKEGVKLHAIIDACHSGTILDLVHVYNYKDKIWEDNKPPSGVYKGTSGGLAISLSACADDQLAADTTAFSSANEMTGAMTYIFVQSVKKNPRITYGDLLNEMHEKIKEANTKGCLSVPLIKRVFRSRQIQDPLLSSSKIFDVNEVEFKL